MWSIVHHNCCLVSKVCIVIYCWNTIIEYPNSFKFLRIKYNIQFESFSNFFTTQYANCYKHYSYYIDELTRFLVLCCKLRRLGSMLSLSSKIYSRILQIMSNWCLKDANIGENTIYKILKYIKRLDFSATPELSPTFHLKPSYHYISFSRDDKNPRRVNMRNIQFTLKELLGCMVWWFFRGIHLENSAVYHLPHSHAGPSCLPHPLLSAHHQICQSLPSQLLVGKTTTQQYTHYFKPQSTRISELVSDLAVTKYKEIIMHTASVVCDCQPT